MPIKSNTYRIKMKCDRRAIIENQYSKQLVDIYNIYGDLDPTYI